MCQLRKFMNWLPDRHRRVDVFSLCSQSSLGCLTFLTHINSLLFTMHVMLWGNHHRSSSKRSSWIGILPCSVPPEAEKCPSATWAQRSLTTDTIPLLMTCWELAFKHPERHYTFVHRQNVRIIEHPDPTCQKEIYCTAGPLPQAEICTYLLQLQTWWYTLFEEDLSLKTLRMPCMAFVACFLSLRWNPEALDWQQWLQACT